MNTNEPTNHEVLEAINDFSGNMDKRFNNLESEVAFIKSEMVTKDFLEDKLADLKGDIVILTRKEDTKVRELITILREKNILSDNDTKRILSMEPFPQLMP